MGRNPDGASAASMCGASLGWLLEKGERIDERKTLQETTGIDT